MITRARNHGTLGFSARTGAVSPARITRRGLVGDKSDACAVDTQEPQMKRIPRCKIAAAATSQT